MQVITPQAVNPFGFTFSCNACIWLGTEPDVTNGSRLLEDGTKLQTHQTVCPNCGAYVAPVAL